MNWSRCVHISRADNPPDQISDFRVVIATESTTGETGPPWGSCRRSSRSSSWTAFSATGLLLRFLTLRISRTILWSWRTGYSSKGIVQWLHVVLLYCIASEQCAPRQADFVFTQTSLTCGHCSCCYLSAILFGSCSVVSTYLVNWRWDSNAIFIFFCHFAVHS